MSILIDIAIFFSLLLSIKNGYGLSKLRRYIGYEEFNRKWKKKISGKRYEPKILPEKNGEYLDEPGLLAAREYKDVAAWLHKIYENSEWGFEDSASLSNRDNTPAREVFVYYNQQRVGNIEIRWLDTRLKKSDFDEISVALHLHNARQFDGYSVVDLAHQVARIVQPLDCQPDYWNSLETRIISKLILSSWQTNSVINEYEDRDQTLVFGFSGSGAWYKSRLKSEG